MATYIPWTVRVALNFTGRQIGGSGSGSGGSATDKRDFYIFSGEGADFFDLVPDLTGNIKVTIAGTSSTGVHPDLLAGLDAPWVDTTDLNNPMWNYMEADVTALPHIVDNTFTGIIERYAKDDVWYLIDMGAQL